MFFYCCGAIKCLVFIFLCFVVCFFVFFVLSCLFFDILRCCLIRLFGFACFSSCCCLFCVVLML